MKRVKVKRTMSEVISDNHGLSLYLNNLSRGREMTPRSWLYEGQSAEAVLKRWIPIMEAANNKTRFGEVFNSFDQKQIKKFGPQGGIPPFESRECQEVLEPLYESSKYDDPEALSEYYELAEKFGRAVFGKQTLRCRPIAFESVVKDMQRRDTLTTNSGYPRFTRRKTVFAQEIADARDAASDTYPAIVLFRYYYGKLRPVWMFPMSVNLREASFALRIQSALQSSDLQWVQNYVSPWKGFEFVKDELTSELHTYNGVIAGGDTTKMDAHMRPAQLNLVFHIVKWLFQKEYWEDLQKSLLHVCDIDLLVSETELIRGTHGLASGSSWTQLSETVLQLFMAYNAGVIGQGIGDDFYWLCDLDAEELVEYLQKFGLPANAEKQSISETELPFLQRLFIRGFTSRSSDTVMGAYYPTIRALGSMLLPEKFHNPKQWSTDMFCIRNYMILENCVDDPCFDEFVRFVVHGHKEMISFANKTNSTIDQVEKLARTVPGLFPNYNQEKLTKPLHTFEAIKIARSM